MTSTPLKPRGVAHTPHYCFTLADEKLKEKNTQLSHAIEFPSGKVRLVIGSEKIHHRIRQGPVRVCATFCPFCGEKL